MNKSAIQKYAIWARNELREQIAKRGYYFGIDADGINVDSKDETCVYARDSRLLTDTERKQRNELFQLVKEKGFDQVVEEVSYTWFNRLIALRFMEVNDYLPEHIRVLSNSNNEFKPEIKTRALDLEDPHFDKKKILDLIDKNDDEELYRYLLLTECNALNDILPQMFEKIGGYTELLLPNNLLKADSVIGKLVSDIDEADWDVKSEGGQVQIIGWLYQYYNQELKDQTFNDLKKKNKKISKERIPAATQLFTPDWIVHYMVENSLGRMWVEGHPNEELKSTWKYYLEDAEQEPEVEEQLKAIRKEYSKLNPQDIKFFDPAMGSGHILVVAFDILMQIYESQGIRPREAAKSILENNLYGLDIDDRAAQLAYFAVMMKAREYDRRIFNRDIQPQLYSIQESNGIDDSLIDYVAGEDKKLRSDLKTLVKEMKDAKEYGSIITVSELDFDSLEVRLNELKNDLDLLVGIEAVDKITPLVKVGRLLAQRYEIVCTNPPYMGNGKMNAKLLHFVKENFPINKIDLFSVFMERGINWLVNNGLLAMITQHSWMFLSRFEKLRFLLRESRVINMAHLGARAFEDIGGEVVQTTAFVLENKSITNYRGTYTRLVNENTQQGKENQFLKGVNRFVVSQEEFDKIPGNPIAYWVSPILANSFASAMKVGEIIDIRHGMSTGNNDAVLKSWMEVDYSLIKFDAKCEMEFASSASKYAPYNKGGDYRKWYGNQWYVIGYDKHYNELMDSFSGHRHDNRSYYFREGFTWSTIGTGNISLRFTPAGSIFDSKGSMGFTTDTEDLLYAMAFINSKVSAECLRILSPTIDFNTGSLRQLPFIVKNRDYINQMVRENIEIAKYNWDSSETSWGFQKNPLIEYLDSKSIESSFLKWKNSMLKSFDRLKRNEETINEHFIGIFGLQDEINPEEKDQFITPSCNIPIYEEEVKNLISYSVGCMFGRYSLDKKGLIYPGSPWKETNYISFCPDADNIIPISNDEYFNDDISTRFIEFIRIAFGTEKLESNLGFIANALKGSGNSREKIRNYFLNDFFDDHCNKYSVSGSGRRPIYWLFDSGKKNGFKCLIYMHRYTPDTLARIRTDYVHEQQERYRSQIKHIQETIDTVPKSEQVKMKKELKDLEGKAKEVAVFEEKLHHLADQMIEIDLDDGVKHNYALFQDVLAKIK